MSAMSYAIALATGILIGLFLIPWFQNMMSFIIRRFLHGPRPMTNASHNGDPEFTDTAPQIAARATARTVNSSSPKARAKKTRVRDPALGQAPTLYEYEGRLHVSPYCSGADKAWAILAISEPCSQCTNSKTPLAQEELYRTNKGEKYHTRNCHHIQARLAKGASQAYFVRALTTCRCVVDYYQQSRQLEDGNDKEH